jgi:PAS domain S-box-containing protein
MKGTEPQVVTLAGANLLTLSLEPMLAWQLDGPIAFWNTGAERLYGFAPDEVIGRSSHALLQTKFRSNLPTCAHNSRTGITGQASCVTPARMAAKSL